MHRVINFWCLKPGFRRIPSSNVWKCARKVRFHNPCTSAASESEFDHANGFLSLNEGMLVFTVSRLAKAQGQLSIAFLLYGRFTGRFVVAKTNRETYCTPFLSLDVQDVERGQFRCTRNCIRNLRVFQLRLSVRVLESEFFSLRHWPRLTGIDRNYANRPVIAVKLLKLINQDYLSRYLRQIQKHLRFEQEKLITNSLSPYHSLPVSVENQKVDCWACWEPPIFSPGVACALRRRIWAIDMWLMRMWLMRWFWFHLPFEYNMEAPLISKYRMIQLLMKAENLNNLRVIYTLIYLYLFFHYDWKPQSHCPVSGTYQENPPLGSELTILRL